MDVEVHYKYNQDGVRILKQSGEYDIETHYSVRGNLVIAQRTSGIIYYYFYDEMDQPIGMSYYDVETNEYDKYHYKKNLQGDIIGILDSNLNEVVKYTYDSWGEILSITDEKETSGIIL